jgi:hypothetical protein
MKFLLEYIMEAKRIPINNHVSKGLFGSAISISAILKITFLKIVFLKSLLFKIIQAFGKTC